MADLLQLECCGIAELHDMSDPPKIILLEFCEQGVQHYNYILQKYDTANLPHHPFVIFSEIVRRRGAENLRKYIKEHNLGPVWTSPVKTNPNSRNRLKMYVWQPDYKKILKWYKSQPNTHFSDIKIFER